MLRMVAGVASALLLAVGAPIAPFQTLVHDPDPLRPCRDEHTACGDWARDGECQANEGFMRMQCALSCGSCGWVNPACTGRTAPAMTTGGINAMFEAAVARPELRATVHSRPPDGPWIITLDDFVSADEAAAFIETTDHHFQRSLAGDVISPAWCQPGLADSCFSHPLINRVHARVVNVTGVPKENAEFFQVLRYEPGQFYRTHHDQNAEPDSLMGVRLLTFFIYLQAPAVGGGTRFPRLNVTVQPKRGTALLWPNVLDEDLGRADLRTNHEALPPEVGLKFASNLWLHQFDFRWPSTHGCDLRLAVDPSRRLPPLDPSIEQVPWPGGANGDAGDEHEENDEL